MRNASTATRMNIAARTLRSTWRSRRRRKVRLASGINIIEINIAVSSSDSWKFDTGSMIHT
jgi:hypothetical protein